MSDVDSLSILESLGPARRFADPEAAIEGRLMAARGALPLPPDQIATVLFALTFDPEAEVKERALGSLEALPDRVIDAALSAPLHPAVLAWFAPRFRDDEARLEKIALNAAASDETYCFLATLPLRRIVDIVAGNQTRLVRCPELVEALSENPATSQATMDRILEFLGLEVESPAPSEDGPAPDTPDPLDADRAGDVYDPDDPSSIPDELMADEEPPEGEEAHEEYTRGLASLIGDMKIIDKIKLARFGNGEARSLLLRDRNKLVAAAAIRSPKIKEPEVVAAAKARNVCDEVLRIIAHSRTFTKSYAVKLALVTNPKAPATAAIKFLNYLTDRDLRAIMRSRDVPSQVSVHARRLLMRKGKI